MPWLIVAGDFTPLGGMDRANYALARYLARETEVHLAAHRVWPDLAGMPGVQVHRAWRPFGRHALGRPWLARAGRRVALALADRRPAVVVNGGNCAVPAVNWVHYLHAAYRAPVAGGAMARAKAAWTYRGDVEDERRALALARLVICNSERTRRDVIDRVGIEPSRVRTVYYGSDPVRLAPPGPEARRAARAALGIDGDRPVVAFVGALGDRRKAFDALFAAWSMLSGAPGWDGVLAVIGTGAELPAWQRRAADAGLGASVRFAGFRPDVPELLAGVDVLVHPARYEAYGLAVREALTRGVPALVSRSAGVAEHYPPDLDALLLENPDDAAEIAARLQTWRSAIDAYRRRVDALATALRARTWDTMAAEFVAAAGSVA